MRGFIILCVLAVAAADQLGYNYQPLGHDVAVGGGIGGGIGAGSGFGGTAVGGFNGGFGGYAGGGGGAGHGVGQLSEPIAEYNKEFYTYSAPEEEFNDHGAAQRLGQSLKKNLRVIFIRAPENQGLANAALQLAKQASQDKTAIYVLNKQTDLGDLANKLQALKSGGAQRPDVHFVKYRTADDAARAQQSIQAQYDALAGPSRTSHEGTAPVLNFASPSTSSSSSGLGGGYGNGGALVAPATSYLPPSTNYLPPVLRLKK